MLGVMMPAGGFTAAAATTAAEAPAAAAADGARFTADCGAEPAATYNWRYFCISTAELSDA